MERTDFRVLIFRTSGGRSNSIDHVNEMPPGHKKDDSRMAIRHRGQSIRNHNAQCGDNVQQSLASEGNQAENTSKDCNKQAWLKQLNFYFLLIWIPFSLAYSFLTKNCHHI